MVSDVVTTQYARSLQHSLLIFWSGHRKRSNWGIISVILALIFSQNLTASQLSYHFETNVDQRVVKVFDTDEKNDFFIVKRYLTNRKASAIPVAKPFTEYLLIANNKPLSIMKLYEEMDLSFADMIGTPDSFVFGASSPNGQKYVFQYQASANQVENISGVSVTTQTTDRAYTEYVDNGMVFVLNTDPSSIMFSISPQPGSEGGEVHTLLSEPGVNLVINDSKEFGAVSVVIGHGFANNDPMKPFVFLINLETKGKDIKVDVKKHQFNGSSIAKLGFISSSHPRQLLHIVSRIEKFEPHTDSLLDSDLNLIWQRKARFLSGDHPSFAGVCDDQVLILQTKKSDSLINKLEYGLLDDKGQYSKLRTDSIRGSSSLLDTFLHPTEDSLVKAYFNFVRTEDERRQDGWYSWEGYQVDEIAFECN